MIGDARDTFMHENRMAEQEAARALPPGPWTSDSWGQINDANGREIGDVTIWTEDKEHIDFPATERAGRVAAGAWLLRDAIYSALERAEPACLTARANGSDFIGLAELEAVVALIRAAVDEVDQ